MGPGSGGRLPGARRRRGLGHPLPPGTLQPGLPQIPDHRGPARGPGRRLPGSRAFPVREAHPVQASRLPPLGGQGARLDRGGGRGTALFLGLVIPFSGWAERVIIGLFGALFLFALFEGFVHVRAGRVAPHREWMIRAFAIALAIATQRLIFVPAFFLVADPTLEQAQALSAAAFLAAFVAHAGVAEVWIRLTRRRRDPKASGTRVAQEPTLAR